MSQLFIGPTRLGDAILATGVLAWLAETHPDQPITVACGAPAALAFGGAPGVEALHVVEKRPRGGHWIELWRKLRGRRWRRIVDLRRSLLPLLLRADARHTVPRGRPGEHRVALAARALGLPPQAPRVWPAERHRAVAARLLPADVPVLALGPGANWVCKTWPPERFAALAARLLGPGAPLAGGRLLLVGGEAERAAARAILEAMPPTVVADGFGLDIPTTAAALERCALFVGNDSAMMHLAAAAGARTVGLFGPTRDEHYAPWGPNGLAVRTPEGVEALLARLRGPGVERTLMDGLEVEAVVEAIAGRWPDLGRGAAPPSAEVAATRSAAPPEPDSDR